MPCRKGRIPPVLQALQLVRFRKLRGRNPAGLPPIPPAVRDGELGCSRRELRSCPGHRASVHQIPSPPEFFAPMPCDTPRRGGRLGTNNRNSTRKLSFSSHPRLAVRNRDDRAAVLSSAPR